MRISDTPTDLLASSDQVIVWSESHITPGVGQVERVGVDSLVKHLAEQPTLINALMDTPQFRSLLTTRLLELLTAAGFSTEAMDIIASAEGVYYNPGYVVPGQSLPPAESGISVGGTVDVEE